MIDKVVQLPDYQVRQLEQMAAARGTTENALIEEALALFLHQTELKAALREEWGYLQQLQSEIDNIPEHTVPSHDPNEFTVTHAVPVVPENIRNRGEIR
jgi:hypothetical protein